MATPDSERAALAAAHDAREQITYALLRRDDQAADTARAALDAANHKIAKSRRTRLRPLIDAALDEAALTGDDPIAAALAGASTWDQLVEQWQHGQLDNWLTDAERRAVQDDQRALRVVLSARMRDEDFSEVQQRYTEVRDRHGYALAARSTSKSEVQKLSSLIEQSEAHRPT